jgi:hypothetical protein
MYGATSLSQVTLPALVKEAKEIAKSPNPPKEEIVLSRSISAPPAPAPEVKPETPIVAPVQKGPFTGLIVDCLGLKIAPSMSPKILDEGSVEIWGTMQIDPDLAIERGIVGYYRTLDDARKSGRAGDNPLVIKATGKAGRSKLYPSDAVVSLLDGKLIVTENGKTKFLEKLNVCFVID